MDILNNVRNNVLDNIRSIKCLFHQVMDLKESVGSLEWRIDGYNSHEIIEREEPNVGSLIDMAAFYRLEAKVLELDNKVNSTKRSLKSLDEHSY